MMKKILITGGAGFIGFHLAKHLLDGSSKIVIADNFFRSEKDADFTALLSDPNVELIEGDLTQMSGWDALGGDYDDVYHLAAINGTRLFYEIAHEVLRVNLLTTINAVEWMRTKNPQGKLLFTSSSELFAGLRESFEALPIPTPETVPAVISDISNPRWSYAGTKIIGEQLLVAYSKKYNFRTVIVRPSNFYGPRALYDHVIPDTIDRVLRKVDPFPLYGEQDKRSYCYIDDAVEAMALLMKTEKSDGQTYNIGSLEEAKPGYIAEAIFSLAKWKPTTLEHNPSPAGSVKRRVPDISKITHDTGWVPHTSLVNGLEKTFEWYKNYSEHKGI